MRVNYGTKWSRSDRYTPEEDAIIWQAYLAGDSYQKIMTLVNRGYAGITVRIRKLRNENA